MSLDADNIAARDLVVACVTAQRGGDLPVLVTMLRGADDPAMVAYWAVSLVSALVELIAALNAMGDPAAPTADEWWQRYALSWAAS